jgi:prepilin-type processing-associated H-X9-DG protein
MTIDSNDNYANVCFWDGTAVQQLTDNDTDAFNPQIDNGQVVWMGYYDYDAVSLREGVYFWDGGVTNETAVH